MEFSPKKRVGSPASVKGVRGDYLTALLMWIGVGLFCLLIFFVLPLPIIAQVSLVMITIALLFYKYMTLKTLSKGDIYRETKKSSRKKILVISSPIKISIKNGKAS